MISYDDIQPVIDRMFKKTATAEDFLFYLRFEMQEIMKFLPPDAKGEQIDGYHAGCCALRAFATILQLERAWHASQSQTEKDGESK